MKISLIIPAYNEEKYISDCLDSVIKHTDGKLHEIIVIDNASSDRTHEIAKGKAGVRVVHESRKGLTRARQRGLEEATGDFLAYIDADTRVHKDWLKKVESIFAANSNAVCVSGPYRYYDGSKFMTAVMHACWWLSAPISYRIIGYMVLGGNFVAKKDALVAMGGFDKNIEFYGEDTNIARRLSEHGDVIFRMDFFIHSSSRRFQSEGLIKTNVAYVVNLLWEIIFHKPFSQEYKDVRLDPNK